MDDVGGTGQRAVITGASGAIGGAIAAALGQAGYELALVGRNEQSVSSLLRRYRGFHLRADLARADDVEAVCEQLGGFEHVGVAVHAAGGFRLGAIATLPVAELDELYHVNVRAPYRLTQALLPSLRSEAGQLVFVNSSASARPPGELAGAYAATKYALRAIADAVRAEENANAVRVVSVYPGRTAGPLQERLHQLEGRTYDPDRLLQPEDVATALMSALMLPPTAEATDIHVRPMRKPLA